MYRGGGEGLPRFVERELREFLTCGVLAEGFARFRCTDCQREILVAFSCKGRGFCPSCCGRRMAELAAHLMAVGGGGTVGVANPTVPVLVGVVAATVCVVVGERVADTVGVAVAPRAAVEVTVGVRDGVAVTMGGTVMLGLGGVVRVGLGVSVRVGVPGVTVGGTAWQPFSA